MHPRAMLARNIADLDHAIYDAKYICKIMITHKNQLICLLF